MKESSQRIKPSLVPWACFGFDKISKYRYNGSKERFWIQTTKKAHSFLFFEIEIEINGF